MNGVTPHVSYAGFFNVANATASYESNLYVWFHPAQNQPEENSNGFWNDLWGFFRFLGMH